MDSHWEQTETGYSYHVTANRFLRGMVRGLVGTMLKVGRNKFSIDEFEKIIESKESSMVDFSVPAQGLTLVGVQF
jgi:tRNA pseudouridine38-40 synthase